MAYYGTIYGKHPMTLNTPNDLASVQRGLRHKRIVVKVQNPVKCKLWLCKKAVHWM